MNIRSLSFPIISLLLLSVTISCNTKKPSEVPAGRTFLILIDVSESVRNAEILNGFKEDLNTVIGKIKPGDVLIAGVISRNSITEHHLPINIKMPVFEPTTDNDMFLSAEKEYFNNRLTQIKDSLLKVTDTLILTKRNVGGTDIFSAMLLAEKVFDSYTKNQKILVVMSDMMECNEKIVFAKEKLSTKRIEEIISAKKKTGELPDLSNVKVYVTGAGAETSRQYEKIQEFWLQYFKTCKANLQKQNYGSTLITFNE